MKRFVHLFISTITVCLAVLLSPLIVGAQEQVYDYHVREEYFDFSTIPTGTIQLGDSGQVRPNKDSILNGFQYAFRYQVSDPTILAIDEKGNWKVLKEGEVTLTVYGRSQYNESPEFEAELDQRGIKRQIDTTGTTEIPFHVQRKLNVTSTNLQPVYRLYHPGLQVHLYTTDKNENAVLGSRGWRQEGVAWSTSNTGSPVYRLYNPHLQVHLYTKDSNEYAVLATRGWRQEGIAYHSTGTIPVYRLYHAGIRKHLYTRDANEKNVLAHRGWTYEGVAWTVE